MGHGSGFSRPVAIVILPLLGFFFERDLDEPLSACLDRPSIACTSLAYLHLAHYFSGGRGCRRRRRLLWLAVFSQALSLSVSLQS